MVCTKYYCFLPTDSGCWMLDTYLTKSIIFIQYQASSINLLEHKNSIFVITFEHGYKLQVPFPLHYPISGCLLRLSRI